MLAFLFDFVFYFVGLAGTLMLISGGLTFGAVSLATRRYSSARIPAAILLGYAAGAMFAWTLIPHRWPLPLWTTLAASVNAAKYGHPVEHYAQGIVVLLVFSGVAGAIAGGASTYFAGRFVGRRRQSTSG